MHPMSLNNTHLFALNVLFIGFFCKSVQTNSHEHWFPKVAGD